MLGHALCHALSFHSQTITHSITNNLPQSKQLLRSLNNGCELLSIVMGVDLVPLHYSRFTTPGNPPCRGSFSPCEQNAKVARGKSSLTHAHY